jgi:hypothetical protein
VALQVVSSQTSTQIERYRARVTRVSVHNHPMASIQAAMFSFRRQFRNHVGFLPGELRRATDQCQPN